MENISTKDLLKLTQEELEEKLKSMPPEQRLSTIKELEKEREKEKTTIEKLKERSLKEINLEENTSIYEPETQEPWKNILYENSELEQEVENSSNEEFEEQSNYRDDVYALSGIYNELKEIVDENEKTYQSIDRAGAIYEKILKFEQYNPQEETKEIAYRTRKLMKMFAGDYISSHYHK
ncbi:MAG: hypothetical protein ACQESF_03175 [Nanobdellota archaeon]